MMNKPEVFKLFNERDLIPDEALVKTAKLANEIASKCEYIKYIRNTPKKVIITDSKTGIKTEYPSIYRASRTLGCLAAVIVYNNSKIWRKR